MNSVRSPKRDCAPRGGAERIDHVSISTVWNANVKGVERNDVEDDLDPIFLAPAYDMGEACRYLHVPYNTLYGWFQGDENHRAVLQLAAEPAFISFVGLLEAHVISSLRNHVPMQRIRRAVEYLETTMSIGHPLVSQNFRTNGIDLFIECGLADGKSLVNISRHGQTALREIVELYLSRIEYGKSGFAESFFPFTQSERESDPKIIVINPHLGFGRPVIRKTGIRASAIAERFKGGEGIRSLAEDFGRKIEEIEAAIRSELDIEIAA